MSKGWSTQALIMLWGGQRVLSLQAPLRHCRADIADFTESAVDFANCSEYDFYLVKVHLLTKR